MYYHAIPIHIFIGLEINFEESDYSFTEGAGLSTPIRLQFRIPVTIAAVEGKGLGASFISSAVIVEESRAEPGDML